MITLLIFAATYALVAIGPMPGLRVSRTGAAIAGALLMIATGAIGIGAAVRAIDVRTIVLLTVMMAVVAPLRLAGLSGRAVVWASDRVVHPAALLALIAGASGLLSALLINDTVCLALTPLVLDLAALRHRDPLPYLVALATASNIGSVATIVGNPQNILIGSLSGIGFWRFTVALTPVALAALAIDVGVIWLVFGRRLRSNSDTKTPVPELRHSNSDPETLTPELRPRNSDTETLTPELRPRNSDTETLTPELRPRNSDTETLTPELRHPITPAAILRAIDWRLLLLFAGLFIVVGAAQRAGIDRRLFELLAPLGLRTVAGLTATTAVVSNVVSNVPAVMLLAGVIPYLPDPHRAWLTLAMASTLAGNLTILGSIANLIVVEGALRRGVTVSFWDYAKVGIPITLTTLAIGAWWMT